MKNIIALICIVTLSSCVIDDLKYTVPEEYFQSKYSASFINAVMHNKYKVADELLAQGANVNDVGKEGLTPLLWVLARSNFDINRVEYLLDKGANPNYQEPRGRSPMSISVENGNVELTKLFIIHNANINQISFFRGEESLLSIAALNGDMPMVKTLVEAGADLNWQEQKYSSSAADAASSQARFDIVYFLVESGLTVDLGELKLRVTNRAVPPNSEAQQWKDRVLKLLEERIVKR